MTNRRSQLLDEMLVLRCQEGAADAFEELIARWQERLWRHAYRLTGRHEAAWDVIQESWLAITRGIRRLDDAARFGRWAYTIVTRQAATWQRRRGRHERDEALDAAGDVVSVDRVQSESGRADAQTLLREALGHLSRQRQMLLSLRYLEGFEVSEIARILGVPEGTVKSRLHHARAELRRIVERIDR